MAEENEAFESPRLLLAGAARHIETFKSKLEAMRAQSWATFSVDEASRVITVKSKIPVPQDMKQIVFDLTNNLRSALDHAVYASTVLITGEDRNNTKFPIGDTAKDAQDDAKRKCRGVPPEMLDFLLALETHRDGNPIVWGLNKLRNTKSHRVLVPMGSVVSLAGVGDPTPGTSMKPEWDSDTGTFKPNLELAEGTDLGAVVYAFRLEVLIGTGAFKGEPAPAVFDRMLSEVEGIVSAIEAETDRILRECARK